MPRDTVVAEDLKAKTNYENMCPMHATMYHKHPQGCTTSTVDEAIIITSEDKPTKRRRRAITMSHTLMTPLVTAITIPLCYSIVKKG